MQERVSSGLIARAMDEVIEKAGLRIPNKLHRLVAEQTGLHPTTVLRYHRQELESADLRVLECVQDIGTRLANGEKIFDEYGDPSVAGLEEELEEGIIVSTHELNRWVEKLRSRLGMRSTSFLYQWLEDELGIPASTIMRYHTGELHAAPSAIMHALRALERMLCAGEPVAFRRGPGDPVRHVPRSCLKTLLDEIEDLGLVTGAGRTSDIVSLRLGLPSGGLASMIGDESWPFVRLDVYERVRDLRDQAMYDPRRHYEVGDRIWFPDLGTGTVVLKLPKQRMLVTFDSGMQRQLREDIWVDPRAGDFFSLHAIGA